jgi:hypothetical protein
MAQYGEAYKLANANYSGGPMFHKDPHGILRHIGLMRGIMADKVSELEAADLQLPKVTSYPITDRGQ